MLESHLLVIQSILINNDGRSDGDLHFSHSNTLPLHNIGAIPLCHGLVFFYYFKMEPSLLG